MGMTLLLAFNVTHNSDRFCINTSVCVFYYLFFKNINQALKFSIGVKTYSTQPGVNVF